jgi:hypothetical protein
MPDLVICPTCGAVKRFGRDILYGQIVETCGCGTHPMKRISAPPITGKRMNAPASERLCSWCAEPFTARTGYAKRFCGSSCKNHERRDRIARHLAGVRKGAGKGKAKG